MRREPDRKLLLRRWLRSLAPESGTLRENLAAAVPGVISSVPDGTAAGLLAAGSPVHGRDASIFGQIVGGLTSSSKLEVITTTSAAGLATGSGSAVADVPVDRRPHALFLFTLMAGSGDTGSTSP